MKALFVFIVVFLILSVAGHVAYEDWVVERDHYTYMVCEGTWPNYKKLNVNCEELRHAETE